MHREYLQTILLDLKKLNSLTKIKSRVGEMMNTIFNDKTRDLEADIEGYLDRVTNAGLIFLAGVRAYLNNNKPKFEHDYEEITNLESEADDIRRDIKYSLYAYMLIPESRGDVLGILETMDDIIDICEKVLEQISIESPEIPDALKHNFNNLAELSAKAVDEVVKAARSFFHQIKLVPDYVSKVHFYEHEADDVEENLKRKAFQGDIIDSFSQKVHMRYFAEKIAAVSDVAEQVAERLSVYAIKRKV